MEGIIMQDTRQMAQTFLRRNETLEQAVPGVEQTIVLFRPDQFLHYQSARRFGIRLGSLGSGEVLGNRRDNPADSSGSDEDGGRRTRFPKLNKDKRSFLMTRKEAVRMEMKLKFRELVKYRAGALCLIGILSATYLHSHHLYEPVFLS